MPANTDTFLLDKRAHHIIAAAAGEPEDDLLNTTDLAEWLGVSTQWCEIARHRGRGPKWVALSTRRVRYRRSDVLAWLEERTRVSTAGWNESAEAEAEADAA